MFFSTRTHVLTGALGVLLSAAAAQAQETPQPPPGAQAPPVFGETVEVTVINLEVVVTDPQGLPVTGLVVEDFRLLVDGAELPIDYFTEVRGGTAIETEVPSEGPPVPGVPALAPGSAVETSYLVFIDDFFAVARDRDLVLRSLSDQLSRLGPDDRMAVVAYDGNSVDMLSTWSQSTTDLERALRKAMQRPAFGLQRVAEKRNFMRDTRAERRLGINRASRPLDSRLDITERFYAELLESQLDNTVGAAAASLRGFANPPGRKVLLLLSGGWPFDIGEHVAQEFGRAILEPEIPLGRELYSPLVDTANQLGYTVYPVDVPGLASEAEYAAEFDDVPSESDRFNAFVRENNAQYSLHYVAHQTGGQPLLNAGRQRALEVAAGDTRSYYWIGFEPTWKGDDTSHRAEIEVRREGLNVRSRTGFRDMSRQRAVSMAVESILMFGDAPDARPLELSVDEPQKSSGGGMRVPIRLAVPAADITFLPQGDQRVAELELRVAAIDDRGGRSDVPVLPVRLTVNRPPLPGERAQYHTTLELRRVRNRIVVALYDPLSGTLWSGVTEVRP